MPGQLTRSLLAVADCEACDARRGITRRQRRPGCLTRPCPAGRGRPDVHGPPKRKHSQRSSKVMAAAQALANEMHVTQTAPGVDLYDSMGSPPERLLRQPSPRRRGRSVHLPRNVETQYPRASSRARGREAARLGECSRNSRKVYFLNISWDNTNPCGQRPPPATPPTACWRFSTACMSSLHASEHGAPATLPRHRGRSSHMWQRFQRREDARARARARARMLGSAVCVRGGRVARRQAAPSAAEVGGRWNDESQRFLQKPHPTARTPSAARPASGCRPRLGAGVEKKNVVGCCAAPTVAKTEPEQQQDAVLGIGCIGFPTRWERRESAARSVATLRQQQCSRRRPKVFWRRQHESSSNRPAADSGGQ